MDVKKLNIPTLDSPNWWAYSTHLQAAAHILGFWELIKGELADYIPIYLKIENFHIEILNHGSNC